MGERSMSYKVPKDVQAAAKKGLMLRRMQPKSKKAGLDARQAHAQGIGSGVARARDLIKGTVSYETVKRMKAYFDRHRGNYRLDKGKDPIDDKGYVAGLLWGGEAGKQWANKVIKGQEISESVPSKYLKGLDKETQRSRAAEIKRRAKGSRSYEKLPGDDAKTVKSKHTKTQLAFRVREEIKGSGDDEFLRAASKVSGVPQKVLSKVLKRGYAAWASGHRPGATQAAWGRARVYSFLTGGKTRYTTDKDLVANTFGENMGNANDGLAEARYKSTRVGPGKWKVEPSGKIGVWRMAMGKRMFFPDDGSEPIGVPPKLKKTTLAKSMKGKGVLGRLAGKLKDFVLSAQIKAADRKVQVKRSREDRKGFSALSDSDEGKELLARIEQALERIRALGKKAPKGLEQAVKLMAVGLRSGNARKFNKGSSRLKKALVKAR
tara:strand:+ start:2527 stop:3828 length:1302 start_codon:yes stop_codon:yes gene_type:complete